MSNVNTWYLPWRLENVFQAELYVAHIRARCPDRAETGINQGRVGQTKVRMICKIEGLKAELKFLLLSDYKSLENRQIPVHDSRSVSRRRRAPSSLGG